MSIVYIKTDNLNITHEDQEQHGLKFSVLVTKDNINYVKVTGEDAEIAIWKTRVSGENSTLDEINTVIDSLSNSNKDIEQLQNTVAELIKETLK